MPKDKPPSKRKTRRPPETLRARGHVIRVPKKTKDKVPRRTKHKTAPLDLEDQKD